MKYILLTIISSFFVVSGFCTVDTTIGISAPGSATKSYQSLAHYLCDGQTGEQAKANALYNWVTHNIRYDVKAAQSGKLKPTNAEKTLNSRTAVCEGYARLFTAMCKEVGLKAVNVEGYAKDWMFDNGEKVYIPRHMWCAVMIDGKWQQADPTWGAGSLYQAPIWWRKMLNLIMRKKVTYSKRLKFRFKYDSTYFMQDPQLFMLTHLPADPVWQLADTIMPLPVFEAGDTAMMAFYKQYSHPKQANPKLTAISEMDEDKASLEAADRSYAYNDRCPVILAVKQSLRSKDDIEKIVNDSTADIKQKEKLLNDAIRASKISAEHVKAQKVYFPGEYNDLKKKNRDKNLEAKQYIMKIKTDDKQLITQCKKYQKSTITKAKRINKKASDASARRHGLDPQKVQDQEPSKVQKQLIAPEMLVLDDSIKSRKMSIDTLQLVLNEKDFIIKKTQGENRVRLDSLVKCLAIADSFLIKEAQARLNMKDNYDDEVILWSKLFRQVKYAQADTLHRYYAAYHDTVVNMYEERHKLQVAQYDVYKKNLRDMEKYCKWNSNDTSISTMYPQWVVSYSSAIDSGNTTLSEAASYIRTNKKLFAILAKEYKRQLVITEYMNKAETNRKKLEQAAIAGRQAFDNKENKKQADMLKKRIKEMEYVSKELTKDHL